jgi:hypothetical protein
MSWGSTPDGRAVASRLTRSTVLAAALGGATDTRENTTEIQ